MSTKEILNDFTKIENWLFEDNEYFSTSNEKFVYITLKKFAFNNSNQVYPGIKTIAKITLLSERTVRRTLQQLKEKDLIDIIHRPKEKQRNETNLYIFKDFKNSKPNSQKSMDEVSFQMMAERQEDLDGVTGRMVSEVQEGKDKLTGSSLTEMQDQAVMVSAKEEKDLKKINNNKKYDISFSIKPFSFYKQHFGSITPIIQGELEYWIDELNSEVVLHALQKTLERNIRTWNYAKVILKNWHTSGIKTMQDLENFEQNSQRQNYFTPSNKQIIKSSLDALEEFKRERRIERGELT